MFNPRIKFEMSKIACNEEMKGKAKCKNSRFEPLRGNVHGSSKNIYKTELQHLEDAKHVLN